LSLAHRKSGIPRWGHQFDSKQKRDPASAEGLRSRSRAVLEPAEDILHCARSDLSFDCYVAWNSSIQERVRLGEKPLRRDFRTPDIDRKRPQTCQPGNSIALFRGEALTALALPSGERRLRHNSIAERPVAWGNPHANPVKGAQRQTAHNGGS
jgi:hypothetical protein